MGIHTVRSTAQCIAVLHSAAQQRSDCAATQLMTAVLLRSTARRVNEALVAISRLNPFSATVYNQCHRSQLVYIVVLGGVDDAVDVGL